jgi:altronate hydrolase
MDFNSQSTFGAIELAKALKIDPEDNVAVAVEEIPAGVEIFGATTAQEIPKGHKFALVDIRPGNAIIKYGNSIGNAVEEIASGRHVHTHNMKTGLDGTLDYEWKPEAASELPSDFKGRTFEGYVRPNGKVGIRNEIWIVNTVGCVNMAAQSLVQRASREIQGDTLDGFYTFNHPFGCSQLGDDMMHTQRLLAGLINHPNAAGVLVMGLGCENNQIQKQLEAAGGIDSDRVRFFNAQAVEDEIERGMEELASLAEYAKSFERSTVSADQLIVAGKCGGSDGYSGITANPLVGKLVDLHCGAGGTSMISEVPEMFGAEQLLMKRAQSETVFEDIVGLINNFKNYFIEHHQPIYENPAPGNKDGGITTLEDKSLGCVQKGGHAPIVGVADYGESVEPAMGGLTLVNAPGNDPVSCSAMTAAGAHVVLFTTGRGTPLGVPAPTVKISTNPDLAKRKKGWIDFDAGQLLDGTVSLDELGTSFYDYVLKVASGEQTKNERNGYREIGIWKSGVTV